MLRLDEPGDAHLARVDDAPKALATGMTQQRRLAKSLSRKKKRSHNRRDAAAKLGRHHYHVANMRRYFLHQVSNALVKTDARLVIEDLNVSGMLTNHRLARAISDAGWAEFPRLLCYKQAWRNGQVALLTFTPHQQPEPMTPEKGGAPELFDTLYCRDVASLPRAAARYHGDQAAVPGMLDFAVNVRADGPPSWLLERLAARLTGLGRYPSAHDERRAIDAVAARHRRSADNVTLLVGAAEGFALLPNLRPRMAALIAPSFTEPEAALTAAGVPVVNVVLAPPFGLAGAAVPDEADLVVIGNPTNPTSVLHTREQILALRRPGRIVVVDEAFADAIPGEPQSLAAVPLPDVLVLRSLTKTWALAGLRVGYVLGDTQVLSRLTAGRPQWPLGTLQLEAIAACNAPEAVAEAEAGARRLATVRAEMTEALTGVGLDVVDGCAPFVLFGAPDAELLRKLLNGKGIAVRRCDTFVGLDGEFLRAAVRPEWPVLVDAIAEALR